MPTPHLDQLKPTLEALHAAEVSAPSGMPIATFLQEAGDLQVLVAKPEVRAALLDVGLDPARLDGYPTAVRGAREAQSQWTTARDRRKAEEAIAAVARGEELRDEMRSACRWNLRKNRKAQATLGYIAEGDGIADLIQDLHALATLVEDNAPAFAADKTFDAQAAVAEARQTSETINAEEAEYRLRMSPHQAKELRDRAFTYLDDLLDEIREAGRYAFKQDDEMQRRFASAYWRRFDAEPLVDPPAVDVDQPVVEPVEA